jgi:hypothetical protein
MNISDRIVATIRTGVPALIGYLLALLIAAVPAVADVLAFLDAQLSTITFGVPVIAVLQAAAVAAVIAGYYWVARKIGSKYPAAEKWLLGRSLVPIYVQPITTSPDDGVAEGVTRADYQAHVDALEAGK